ncbi:hypothetical protein ACHAXT_003181 [Thalassiosira profunda]
MMPPSRIIRCICTVAAAVLGLAPQGALAFAPSLNSASKATGASRQHVAIAPLSTPASAAATSHAQNSFHSTALFMSESNESQSSLPVFLDPGTKGGAIVLSLILFVVPIIGYNVATGLFGMDEIEVGRNIGVGFSVLTMLVWGGTYIFRVATKDMTYAKQLKDYEDAVIAKRLEELDEDEVQALVEDIEREKF